ncbi:MAG: hypothetical protein ACYTEL_20325 [Planctomycetota bacterium]
MSADGAKTAPEREKAGESRKVLMSFGEKSPDHCSIFSKTRAFWNETGPLARRQSGLLAQKRGWSRKERRFVKKGMWVSAPKMGVRRERVHGFGKKRVFVEKTSFVFERKTRVRVGGNWLRLAYPGHWAKNGFVFGLKWL